MNINYDMRKIRNLCGVDSTCECSVSTTHGTDVVSVDDCQKNNKGMFVLSKITATKVAIQKMYDKHTAQIPVRSSDGIGLIFSQTLIVEIVDFDKNFLRGNRIRLLEFENNPNLTLGLKVGSDNLKNIRSTTFRHFGVAGLHDSIFFSGTVIFSNFSKSISKLMKQIENPKIESWSGFSLDDLVLENSFSDFSSFIGFKMKTIKIQNVISLNGVELVPDNFLRDSDLLHEISIKNSFHVTLPKHFFDHLFDPRNNFIYNISLELDVWNVQKHSIGKREKINPLIMLNQVIVNEQLRDILAKNNDVLECSKFCQINKETQIDCSGMKNGEKRACGICVKNIIGDDNLTETLNKVCYIVNETLTAPQTTNSPQTTEKPELGTSSVTDVSSTYKTVVKGNLDYSPCDVEAFEFEFQF